MAAARSRVNDFARLHKPAQILLPILEANGDDCVAFCLPKKVEVVPEPQPAIEVRDCAEEAICWFKSDRFIADISACEFSSASRARWGVADEEKFRFAKFKCGIKHHWQRRSFFELPILVSFLRRPKRHGGARRYKQNAEQKQAKLHRRYKIDSDGRCQSAAVGGQQL